MELLLQVADAVEDAGARKNLLEMAVDTDWNLGSIQTVELFWKHIILPGDTGVFESMAEKIMKQQPSELSPFDQVFSKYVDNRDQTGKFNMLEAIATKRMGWLKGEIKKLDKVDKTFSWEMPFADEPENPEIEAFLRGPEESMTTEGKKKFTDFHDAQSFAALYKRSFKRGDMYATSFTMEAVKGGEEPFVKISKTRKWFDVTQTKLAQYREELAQLTGHFNGPPKKVRHD